MSLLSLLSRGNARSLPSDFANSEPELKPELFFLGKLSGNGIFYDRWQRVRRTLRLNLTGQLIDGTLYLEEQLSFDDGESKQCTYAFQKVDQHHYIATSDSLHGKATIEAYGNTLRWKYTLKQHIGSRDWLLNFDDWMFLSEDQAILNRAYARLFGIRVGELFMVIHKNG